MTEKNYDADVAFIRALAELLKESELGEIEVERRFGEEKGLNVRISRNGPSLPVLPPPQPFLHSVPAPQPSHPAPSAETAPAAAAASDPAQHPGAVASPMVGTVYLQPEPGAPAFVKVGDTVAEGQPLLIIEAMKTMNQIPAPHAGKVVRILVEDGSPVEYGSPLMIIE